MPGRSRLPLFATAAALLGLIALLATLQYRWLGRISDAERERMTSTLASRAAAFAEDFDRELTHAYMLFQMEPLPPVFSRMDAPSVQQSTTGSLPANIAARLDRWQTTARYPRMIKECYVAARGSAGVPTLQRFDPAARLLHTVEWPSSLLPLRGKLDDLSKEARPASGLLIRTVAGAAWEDVPALVVPTPRPLALFTSRVPRGDAAVEPLLSYTILLLDREFITGDMLPALVREHFRGAADAVDYQIAVVDTAAKAVVYQSTAAFRPAPDTAADARAELFSVRPQAFPHLAADVRRFTALMPPGAKPPNDWVPAGTLERQRRTAAGSAPGVFFVEQTATLRDRTLVTAALGAGQPKWRLLVKHPAGSLETAVSTGRRRNLLISSSILAVLAASLVLIVVSARRSQELARQQMEFVAAVSHELRTPLAVIRSAGDNLADGIVADEEQIRRYGALVRSEGRRLTEMVEQILELSGIQSGQRPLVIAPVRVDALIDEVLAANRTLLDNAGARVEVDIPAGLPAVAGDAAALRRVFQNLIGNAVKYGGEDGWMGVTARRADDEIAIAVKDRGIGIAPADQPRIFEPFFRAPDVVSAQIQGAGLGLSLVSRIIAAHGGRISVTSVKESGSEFLVHLPAMLTSAEGRAEDARPVATPSPADPSSARPS